MNKDTKLFAFKLSTKSDNRTDGKVWKAREGVAIAGCSIAGGSWPDPILRNRDFSGSDNGPEC